jgi:hypothetical protein
MKITAEKIKEMEFELDSSDINIILNSLDYVYHRLTYHHYCPIRDFVDVDELDEIRKTLRRVV